jgi:hypothetical protein
MMSKNNNILNDFLGDGLKENHTILGLHMLGNEA